MHLIKQDVRAEGERVNNIEFEGLLKGMAKKERIELLIQIRLQYLAARQFEPSPMSLTVPSAHLVGQHRQVGGLDHAGITVGGAKS